jgi:hypothetical protein
MNGFDQGEGAFGKLWRRELNPAMYRRALELTQKNYFAGAVPINIHRLNLY